MALPEIEQLSVEKLLGEFCERKVSLQIHDKVGLTYDIRGNRVTLIESRPFFIDPSMMNQIKVAQFEYSPEALNWTLYWYDMKNRRQPYPTGRNKDSLDKLILEVEKDPTGIFWG